MYKAGKLPSASSNSNVGFGATFRVLGSRDYAGILGSGMATLNSQSLGLGSLHGIAAHKKASLWFLWGDSIASGFCGTRQVLYCCQLQLYWERGLGKG